MTIRRLVFYVSFGGGSWDTSGLILIDEGGSGSLDRSEVFFSGKYKSGGVRVSSICVSVVISIVLVALESGR